MGDLDRIVASTTVDEVLSSVHEMFGDDVRLFVIDHAYDRLVAVDDGEDRPLDGQMRSAMLASETFTDDGTIWIPLPERAQTVFVLRNDHGLAPAARTASIGAALGDQRHRFEELERQRRRKEMSVAAELQWDILPQRADSLGGFDVASVLEPAYEVAGDVFDYAMGDGAVWTYSFDGMGHGVEATLCSVLALSAVRNARRDGASLAEQMSAASQTLFDLHGGSRFVTGAGCRIGEHGDVSIVNAGHETIRHVRGGSVQRLELRADIPLGVRSHERYEAQEGPDLASGDGFVMLSDGLSESRDSAGDAFGAERLDRAVEDAWGGVPLQIGHDIVDRTLDFIAGGDVHDDITVLVVRRRTENGTR